MDSEQFNAWLATTVAHAMAPPDGVSSLADMYAWIERQFEELRRGVEDPPHAKD